MLGIRIPSAISSKNFRLYLGGQIVSLTGTWMHSIAQNWLVWSLTGSSLYLGIINSVSFLPMLFFTLIGGIAADRFPKKRLLILTQALSIIPALVLGILVDMKIITIVHIAISAFLLGTINAFDVPARHSFLIEMVGKESLTGAIALNSAIFNGARLIGPIIAGLIISLFSISTCFYLNAISYGAVIVALSMIRTETRQNKAEVRIFQDLKDAIKFIASEKSVLQVLLLIMVFSLIGIPYIILLPAIASEVFHPSAGLYGIMMGAVGGGSLMAALFIALREEISNKRAYIGIFTGLFSIALFLLSFSREVFLSLVLLFVTGFSIISILATANSLIQHRTPDELRGRVMSLYTLVFLGMAPIGNITIGTTASMAGLMDTLRIISIVTLLTGIIFIKGRKLPSKGSLSIS